VNIRRSVVEGEINETKTEASESALPLEPDLAEVLLGHRERCSLHGRLSFCLCGTFGETTLAGHDFSRLPETGTGPGRHRPHGLAHAPYTYSTLLHSLGAKPVVQKELLRHADITTTLNVYTQAISAEKRAAASMVAAALREA
jgi:integrase